MRIATTVPTTDPATVGDTFVELERIGYDAGLSFESRHDPFLPLALAAPLTRTLTLGTGVAIGFARNPMVLAHLGHDLQRITGGRFVLGLGSQVRPHIERRFSERWSRPAARMEEMVRALRSIWESWQTGRPLGFRGEFYRHDLGAPAFDPGPNPHGAPPVHVGGYGPRMVEAAGAVADGLLVHPFNSRRSVEELVLPALERGRRRSEVERFELRWVTMVVTWADDAERVAAMSSARDQLAFYGSTPAYATVLELHGFGELHRRLNRRSKAGRWREMGDVVPDDLVEAVCVCGPRDEIAPKLLERIEGITDSVSLVNNRRPDPANFADVVEGLQRLTATLG
jgi:probable F420-dependent oxidoreductase